MTSVKGPGGGPNVFDRQRANLENAAEELKKGAKEQLEEAGRHVDAAGDHASMATGHVVAAGVRALAATGAVLEGTVDVLEAGGHAAAAAGYATVGAGGWVIEGIASAARFVAKNVARGFAALANAFTSILRDGKTVTVRELAGDPNAVRFSEEMFGKAAGELNKAGAAMNAAWNSYIEAVDNAFLAGTHVALAAGHTAAVAGNLLAAAKDLGDAGALKLAELGTRVAAKAVQLAEDATEEARDFAILSAKISAAVANRLAIAGQGEIKVEVDQAFQKQIEDFEKQFAQLQAA